MNRALRNSLIVAGIGAAAYTTMTDRKKTNQFDKMMRPMKKMFK
ncbi:hypothetical protein [Bacillus suaedae]|nr:hypothetical protein [Bacillus suaedae]